MKMQISQLPRSPTHMTAVRQRTVRVDFSGLLAIVSAGFLQRVGHLTSTALLHRRLRLCLLPVTARRRRCFPLGWHYDVVDVVE